MSGIIKNLSITCESCGSPFRATRSTAKYCSAKCKKRHQRNVQFSREIEDRSIIISGTTEDTHTSLRLSGTSHCNPPLRSKEGPLRGDEARGFSPTKRGELLYEGMLFLDWECPRIGSGYRNVIVRSSKGGKHVHIRHAATGKGNRVSMQEWDGLSSCRQNRRFLIGSSSRRREEMVA